MDERPPRGQTTNEERWSEILDAAAYVFDERGFKAARLQDIASRVGLLAGSLYYYIRSKEELLFALVKDVHARGVATLAEGPELQGASAPERLGAFIARWMDVQDALTTPAGVVERDLPFLDEEHRAEVESMRKALNDFVRDIVRQGVAEGSFDPSLREGVVANTLFSLLNTTNVWFRRSGRLSYRDVGAWYTHLFVAGLAPSAPSAGQVRQPGRPSAKR